jgi:hypothetical protein
VGNLIKENATKRREFVLRSISLDISIGNAQAKIRSHQGKTRRRIR